MALLSFLQPHPQIPERKQGSLVSLHQVTKRWCWTSYYFNKGLARAVRGEHKRTSIKFHGKMFPLCWYSVGQCIRVQITWPLPTACEDVSDLIPVLGWAPLVSSSSYDICKSALNTATGHSYPALSGHLKISQWTVQERSLMPGCHRVPLSADKCKLQRRRALGREG